MRKTILSMMLSALAVVACGGGGDDEAFQTPGTGNGGGTSVASVVVSSSAASIPVDGSTTAEITALVRNSSNVAVSGVNVSFAASAGNLVVTQATTDNSGVAKATLSANGTTVGAPITVTATAGTTSGNTTVSVVNSQRVITVLASQPQIASDGSNSATITALVRDANNQFVAGVPVQFQATSGGLTVTQAITDDNGAAKATLNAADDRTNRRITVNAIASGVSGSVAVDVTGTRLRVTGPQTLVQNSQATYSVSLIDAGGNGIANTAVTLASAKGNTLSSTTVTTDATGQKTFQLTGVNSGADTITATALGMQAQHNVTVSSQNFAFTSPSSGASIPLAPAANSTATVTVRWTQAGQPRVNEQVTFSSTRGTLSSTTATTNASGDATVTISSANSGPAVITASGNGVTAQVTVQFVATQPAVIAVQAGPATIPTEGQSTITAIVRDEQDNLVQGQTVDFLLEEDTTGGELSVASAITDSQGRAQTVYRASTTSSGNGGIKIRASVRNTAVTGTTSLTVGGQTVFLSLGTGNRINVENNAQYSIDYAVQAIDAAGNAVNNVPVVFSIRSLYYVKGYREWNGTVWEVIPTTPVEETPCMSEDLDFDAILDAGEDTSGTGNNNGKLDPGLVATVTPGSVTTANGGTALVKVIYPKDHGHYVGVRLTATATVQGTESSTSADFLLPVLADDVNKENEQPVGVVSPFGQAASCTNPL